MNEDGIKVIPLDFSLIASDEEFPEYAVRILQNAFGLIADEAEPEKPELPPTPEMQKFDISKEEWREYGWLDDEGNQVVLRVEDPVWLLYTDPDSHRIVDAKGVTHYIRRGWTALRWFQPDFASF